MSELRKRMVRDMQLRNFSPVTQRGYLRAITGLAEYYHRSPDSIGPKEIQDYVVYLLSERKLAVGSCHAIITALRFFYTVTLGQDGSRAPIPQVKRVSHLPEILSAEQLEKLFAAPRNPKHRVLLMTAYSAGLRVSELVHLKVTDIHSDRMMIRVEQGKGKKDRYTLLSKRLLSELRSYWKIKRPSVWLFPGIHLHKPGCARMAQKAYIKAVAKAGITRKGGIHTLRHCFATHLLEAGVDKPLSRAMRIVCYCVSTYSLYVCFWAPTKPPIPGFDCWQHHTKLYSQLRLGNRTPYNPHRKTTVISALMPCYAAKRFRSSSLIRNAV